MRAVIRVVGGFIFAIITYAVISFGSQGSHDIFAHVQSGPAFNLQTIPNAGIINPWLKTVGDVNGDGLLDLVAGGNSGGGLAWFENPSWARHSISTEGGFSTDGEVVDVDNDGDLDVVALTTNQLKWYANPGWAAQVIDTRDLHDVELADFDDDGDLDAVARNQGEFGQQGNELHFYRQNSPTDWTHWALGVPNGEGLRVADLDGDGDSDVVINGRWYENKGSIINGAWTETVFSSSWTHPNAFVDTGDVNGDGRVDVALVPSELAGGTYRVSWFEAPADPGSGNWTEHVVEANVESVLHFVGIADMDSDGDLDLAAAEMAQGSNPDEVKVYLNEGGEGLVWTKVVLATGGSHSMRILDYDADGDQDLYGANWQSQELQLFENQSCQQALDSWQRHVIDGSRPWKAIFVTTGTIDGDNLPDVITGGWWYRNPGTAGGSWARQTIGAPLRNMAAVYDFDGDGALDILGTEGQGAASNPNFVWAHNDGNGTFTVLSNVEAGEGDFLQGVAVARLTSGADLTVGLSWHAANQGIQTLTVPDSPLTATWQWARIATESQNEALSIGDIDRDSDQDLLLGTLWLENGGAGWSPHTLFNTGGLPYGESDPDRNVLADINGDGRLDAVVGYEAISVSGKLAWYSQGPQATDPWSEHVIATVVGPMSLDVADMDGDGDLDVVVGEHHLANPSAARLLVFENVDGAGQQWDEHVISVGDEHHDGAQVTDIDNDGDLDIVSIGWGHDDVLLFENTGSTCEPLPPPSPTPPSPSPTPPSPSPTPPLPSPTPPLPTLDHFLYLPCARG